MSYISILDEFTKDLLDTLQLKPWWEVWREYAYRGSLAVIALLAFSPPTQFKCLHYGDADNGNHLNLSAAGAAVVDTYCKITSIPWYVRHGDLTAFGMSIITYVIANYWIHRSGIKDQLTDISKFGRSIIDLNLTVDEMKKCSVLPITKSSKEKHHTLRRNILILMKNKYRSTLWNLYAKRCCLLCIWNGICAVLLFFAYFMIIERALVVDCDVATDIIQLVSQNSTTTFKCVDETSRFNAFLELIFGVMVALQYMTMIAAFWNMKNFNLSRKKDESQPIDAHTQELQPRSRDGCIAQVLRFFNCDSREYYDHVDVPYFLIMMMGIDTKQGHTIENFSKFLLDFKDKEFEDGSKTYSGEAIVAGDVEFFRILKYRMKQPLDIWLLIARVAFYVLGNGDNDVEMKQGKQGGDDVCDSDYKVFTFLRNISEFFFDNDNETPSEIPGVDAQSRHLNESSAVPNRITGADEHSRFLDEGSAAPRVMPDMNQTSVLSNYGQPKLVEQWFVDELKKLHRWHLLSCCQGPYINTELVADIDFDTLDVKGRSYLFYLLRKSSMDNSLTRFNQFNVLMMLTRRKREKLVHFDGKSVKVEDFFYSEYPGIFRGDIPNFRLCNLGEIDRTNQYMSALYSVYLDYGDLLTKFKDDQVELSSKLNDIKWTKFLQGDGFEKVMAQSAVRQKHWELLVALINTYIIVYTDGKRPDIHGLMGDDIFELQPMLTNLSDIQELIKEALKRPRERIYFVPTAAEHILSISDRDQRNAMIPYIAEASLPGDVKNRLAQIARTNYGNNNSTVRQID